MAGRTITSQYKCKTDREKFFIYKTEESVCSWLEVDDHRVTLMINSTNILAFNLSDLPFQYIKTKMIIIVLLAATYGFLPR